MTSACLLRCGWENWGQVVEGSEGFDGHACWAWTSPVGVMDEARATKWAVV